MLQLHLSDRQFYYPLRCVICMRLEGNHALGAMSILCFSYATNATQTYYDFFYIWAMAFNITHNSGGMHATASFPLHSKCLQWIHVYWFVFYRRCYFLACAALLYWVSSKWSSVGNNDIPYTAVIRRSHIYSFVGKNDPSLGVASSKNVVTWISSMKTAHFQKHRNMMYIYIYIYTYIYNVYFTVRMAKWFKISSLMQKTPMRSAEDL